MKCHICKQELIPDNYPSWHIGDRKMIVHRCNNTKCQSRTEAFCVVALDIIIPDNVAESYTLPIKLNDNWCKLYSFYRNGDNGAVTWLMCKTNTLLELKRFYPINFMTSLDEQLPPIIDKLKTLLLFS